MIRETASLDPTGQLLYKATLPKLGVIANLPNTQKQTQNGETKKHAPNKRTGEISRKRAK